MKKAAILILLALSPCLHAATFFSGETALAATFASNEPRGFDPSLVLTGFLSGQFAFSNVFSVRGEFSLESADMYKNGFTKESTDSTFQINELSATLAGSFLGATHTLSFFLGHFETVGSQQYVRRHLGVTSYASLLTESFRGQVGSIVYPVYGLGGCYSITFKDRALSTGIVFSRISENIQGVPQLNFDWRLACSYRYLTMDFLAGVGAPLYTVTDSGEEVFLLIDTLYYHMGADVLFGNKYSVFSLFLQTGVEYLPIRNTSNAHTFDMKEVYVFVEPRFNFGSAKLYFNMFSFPEVYDEDQPSDYWERETKLLFIHEDDSFGAGLTIFEEALYKGWRSYRAGFNAMVTFAKKHINSMEESDLLDSLNVTVNPFTQIEAGGGTLTFMLQAGVTRFIDNEKGAIKLHIGYKKEL